MLVLLSFVLVLVATVLLVLGLLISDGLNLIYVSIGVSALATVLLVMSKHAAGRARAPALEPEVAPAPVLVGAGAPIADLATAAPAPAPVATAVVAAPVAAAVAGEDERTVAADERGDDTAVVFPIADYDELTEDEVLGLLPQLYSDELDIVEDREQHGRSRTAVLGRLAELRETGTDADREFDDDLPIPGYDDLVVREVIAALGGLGAAELAEIRAHEAGIKNRRTILAAIDRRTGAAVAPATQATSPPKQTPAAE